MHVQRVSTPTVLASIAFLLTFASPAFANISLTGALNPTDPNAVLLISFSVASAQTITMQSYGFGGSGSAPGGTNAAGTPIPAGGFDPYFSLFTGLGNAATFLASNDDGSCPPGDGTLGCHDSTLIQSLGAGNYTLAVSLFDNFSFAENLGTGTLGDGFIGLGIDTGTTSKYAVDVLAPTPGDVILIDARQTSVPEPVSGYLLGTGVLAMGSLRIFQTHRRRR